MKHLLWIFLAVMSGMNASCATSGAGLVKGNENGSPALNDKETVEYQKAVVRCNKTGGSRVVKIEGQLRCF